ncbi:cilia- and flagella-associated protein 107 [Dicentrarchus labrax]|uniref:cilia- and flagella-associated protein 107 n=1 Tax=Dicentrarchus labrax TaxID=13489 RepID=UPI0021F5907D|nr:cilia- and flagella-associated protein 107 [Dicentrarchus labrax]
MAQDKWTQTGWRIEQKYANKVLLGNWAEERLQFIREPETAKSTNRVDYRPQRDSKPDVFERRSALLRAEGLPSKLLFAHRDPPSSHYLVTQYQESYGHKHTNTLPTLRRWHPHSLTWQPERSDRPISAIPTNFGPLQSTKHRLEKPQPHLPSLTVYRSEYQRHPLSTFCQSRFARASRMLSSHLHAANHSNKDLDLRRCSLLQIPDPRFSLRPQSQQAHRQHCGS